jgi:predicted NBD/HSP70 family sugar kinase
VAGGRTPAVSALAVDLGGTWLRATVPTRGLAGQERVRVSLTTTPGELAAQLGHLAAALLGDGAHDVDEIVIAVPTFVAADGRLLDCPALPRLTGTSLTDLVAQEWARGATPPIGPRPSDDPRGSSTPRVRVIPDIAAAALGESFLGTGRGVDRFLCVAIGTGANAAAVIDGQLLTTAHGCMGDAGHVVVEPEGLPCTCGGRGCLETRTSGWALTREAEALGLADSASLVSAAGAGNPRASAVLERAGVALGCAMATWSVLVWPDVIAVAGGVSQAGETLLTPARAALARHAPPYIGDRIQVVAAQLGSEATLAGCLALSTTIDSTTDWLRVSRQPISP